jgi:Meckel syndrome type 1 protein
MPTDTDKKLNGTPEPFRRLVAWGRPPATVFRAGPLPSGNGLSPRPQQPRPQVGPGILSGSMIPRAAPAPAQPVPAPPQAPAEPRIEPTVTPRETSPAAATAVDQAADLTVRALPASKPEPARPVAGGEVADSVAPRPQSPHPTARIANRTPLYVGIALAALAVLALGAWIWTRPPATAPEPAATVAADTVLSVPAPAVPVPAIVPAETLPAPVVAEAVLTPGPVTPAAGLRPATLPPAAVRAPAPTPTPARVAPPPVVVPAPAPAPGPQPTAAERPQTDPEAPVTTRPQPIGPGEAATAA